MVYGSSYIIDTRANPDSAGTNRKSMRGFHPCPENLILLILTYLRTSSDVVKLNMH